MVGEKQMNTTRARYGGLLWLCAALTVISCTPASAASDAEVEGLQMPAWLTRAGKRLPLAIGAKVQNGDQITTGAGSRVLLRLPEGSTVKLGENARFDLDDMAQEREGSQQRFRASLGVERGAFRFTTAPEVKAQSTRNVAVNFRTITATVVGTDLWGKSSDDAELVALVEGKITAGRKGQPPVAMDESRSVLIAPRDTPPGPLVKITLAQLNAFAQETELQPGSGVAGRSGTWKVYASRTPNQEEALAIYERLRDAGYAAAVQPSISQGKQIYQVRIVGLLSEADGVAVAIKLRVELGIQDVRVSL